MVARLEARVAIAAIATVGSDPAMSAIWPRRISTCRGATTSNQRTEEGLRKAVEFFEKALAEGPEFAPAHSGLADAYSLLAHYGVLGAGRGVEPRPPSHAADRP